MDQVPGALQQVLQRLSEIESKLLSAGAASPEVTYAVERINTAKIALGRAQMNVMRKLGQDGDADSSAFMATVPSELLSCHHTLVHNAFSWGDQAEA